MASITVSSACAAPSVGIVSTSCNGNSVSSARAQLGAPVLRNSTSLVATKRAGLGSKTVSNGSRTNAFLVVNPNTNLKFETLSYLPALSEEQILKQVEYIIRNGWIPAIEFDQKGTIWKEGSHLPTYYDGRYWCMWKLPLFGANESSQVLAEVQNCKKEYPSAFVRVIAFDNVRQVQVIGFVVAKPEGY